MRRHYRARSGPCPREPACGGDAPVTVRTPDCVDLDPHGCARPGEFPHANAVVRDVTHGPRGGRPPRQERHPAASHHLDKGPGLHGLPQTTQVRVRHLEADHHHVAAHAGPTAMDLLYACLITVEFERAPLKAAPCDRRGLGTCPRRGTLDDTHHSNSPSQGPGRRGAGTSTSGRSAGAARLAAACVGKTGRGANRACPCPSWEHVLLSEIDRQIVGHSSNFNCP